ncbi:hypothetical protein KY290_005568 [Solanum tuberosum]|uniref:Ubiquitin-like protease family profile domain-containing protein n=1 Tax=Solanum tuberosum TaxID=4113 RepID=A0ABQ7WEI4_SOLTU|nr:hypothetical protein KY289_005947 [Solanum tuberosum]KAH0779141.1 hypothetical protein KY290_005568 [Solanum tuberosum]
MDDAPSFSIGITQIMSSNNNRVFDHEDAGWAENRSKKLHDPLIMAKVSIEKVRKDVPSSSKSKVEKPPKKRGRKVSSPISRPNLPKSVKYKIKQIPAHSLRFGSTYNMGFAEELKLSIGIDGVEKFKNTIFGPYLNIPNCNYQGQITKCLLLLELEQDNIDELHIRHASGNILHFTIKEFAIITGLKCTGNVNEFKYPDSTHSRLIQRYFPDSQNVVNKGRLVQRFRMGQWENSQDALEMAILYFIHTFVFSQLGDANIPIHDLRSRNLVPMDTNINEIVVHEVSKTPIQRLRLPSKIFQSPYVTIFGSSDKGKEKVDSKLHIRPNHPFQDCGIIFQPPSTLLDQYHQWLSKGLLKTHDKKKPKEDKYKCNSACFGFEQMDFVVAFPINKNWFYAMSQPKKCWTDEHIDVVFYYLRKKSKLRSLDQYRYTTVNCLFKTYINNTHERYHCSLADDNLSTQEHMARGSVVSGFERSMMNIINGFEIPAGLPWHSCDDVYIPVNCDGQFHWDSGFFDHSERTDWSSLDAYKDKETGSLLEPKHPFLVEYVQDIIQQGSDTLDCGLFVAAFAEFLSDEIPIQSNNFRSDYLRSRYTTLLWNYGSEKAEAGYVSDNDDPSKPTGHFTPPNHDALVNLE